MENSIKIFQEELILS